MSDKEDAAYCYYRNRLRTVDPDKTVAELDCNLVDREIYRRGGNKHPEDYEDATQGIGLMWNFVTSVEAGLVPEPAMLEAVAEKFRNVLQSCSHIYDEAPPDHWFSNAVKVSSREAGDSFVTNFDMKTAGRPKDAGIEHWCKEVDWAYQEGICEGKSKKTALTEAIENVSEINCVAAPTTDEELDTLKTRFHQWRKNQERPTIAELWVPLNYEKSPT